MYLILYICLYLSTRKVYQQLLSLLLQWLKLAIAYQGLCSLATICSYSDSNKYYAPHAVDAKKKILHGVG